MNWSCGSHVYKLLSPYILWFALGGLVEFFLKGRRQKDELNKKMTDTKEYQTQRENQYFGDFDEISLNRELLGRMTVQHDLPISLRYCSHFFTRLLMNGLDF